MTLRNFLPKCAMIIALAIITKPPITAQSTPYLEKIDADSLSRKIEDIIGQMNLEEKVRHISGMKDFKSRPGDYDGFVSIERLGIPPFKVYHGPYGMHVSKYIKKNGTYYPSAISMACTWNEELVEKTAVSLGKELKASGGQSNAGPSMNIIRDLRGGRSSEYYTEDPFLNGKMGAAYTRGLQSQGNIAIMKHFLCNNQERERNNINVKVSERALREIYLPGYKRTVSEGGVLGVMTGYNYVNGFKNPGYKHTIQNILKDEWGFKGVVMTDWVGSTDPKQMFEAGLDVEMPIMHRYRKELLLDMLEKGEITQEALDEKIRRILYVTFASGVVGSAPQPNPGKLATPETVEAALEAAKEVFVLLKNENNALPLDRGNIEKLAVIGPNGEYGRHFRRGQKTYQMLQGGGSATIPPPPGKMITPFKGISNVAQGVDVAFEPGCYGDHGCTQIKPVFFSTDGNEQGLAAEYFGNNKLEGLPSKQTDKDIAFTWWKTPQIIEAGNDDQGGKTMGFSVRWSGKLEAPVSRLYTFEAQVYGTAKVYINDSLIIDKYKPDRGWDLFAMGSIYLEKGQHKIKVEYKKTIREAKCHLLWDYGNDEYLQRAIELAKKSDAVIMPVGTSGLIETEALDRDEKLNRSESLALSAAQVRLINEIAKVNDRVIVVTFTAGVVCENWKGKVEAIVYGGFPGQEGGNALGSIVWGDVNPSGKLPVSIPKSVTQFPGDFHSQTGETEYKEGIYVGYRYFDKNNLEPAFPFGHGLSYTTFKYGKIEGRKKQSFTEPVTISFPLTNTGNIAGKEVVQLYIHDVKASVDRPQKELKSFQKISLKPGETKRVEFVLSKEDFSFFNEDKAQWVAEPGKFSFQIGSSSKDIRSTFEVSMK